MAEVPVDVRPVDVAIVDAVDVARKGLEIILAADPRLRVAGGAATVAELRAAGLAFDACVLDLPGASDPREAAWLLAELPVVVRTAAGHWRYPVAAWACGARAVLGANAGQVALADAVCDAADGAPALSASLARALLEAIEERGLRPPGYLVSLLEQAARGRTVRRALAALGVPAPDCAAGLEELRAGLRGEGLAVLAAGDPPGPEQATAERAVPPEAARLSAGERDVLELYAGGYSYPEIAARLRVSAYTVKSRVLKAMEKLEVPDGHADIRLLFALYVSGSHRQPELLRRRLDAIRAQAARPARLAGGTARNQPAPRRP
ncbi:MAG TPA: sigma factor-like helix-turn-helix DNA-binding protein [Trebonia sp.]|nr:sigma factor-like helix-turn-helix DNA-binding protein [Trebonia sp.]